jgi:hypothetical protein
MSDKPDKPTIHIGRSVIGPNNIIGSTQTVHGNLTISVGGMPAAPEDVRETFKQQIAALLKELEHVPADQTQTVTEVKMAAEDAAAEADKSQPDKARLQIRGDKLMQAAKNLAAVAPIAAAIAKTLLLIG